jgi:excisionase family DNA binding protein
MANDVGMETRFLTPRDVATLLKVSESQVYALMRSGDLPAIKIGGRGVWRVDRLRLEAWLDEQHDRTAEWVRNNPLIEPVQAPAPQRSSRPSLRLAGPRPLSDEAEVMTTHQAAETIGVSRQNVSHLIQTGRLRARKAGGKWLVSAEDVRSYRAPGHGRSAGASG